MLDAALGMTRFHLLSPARNLIDLHPYTKRNLGEPFSRYRGRSLRFVAGLCNLADLKPKSQSVQLVAYPMAPFIQGSCYKTRDRPPRATSRGIAWRRGASNFYRVSLAIMVGDILSRFHIGGFR
jgi:hypothetical protein